VPDFHSSNQQILALQLHNDEAWFSVPRWADAACTYTVFCNNTLSIGARIWLTRVVIVSPCKRKVTDSPSSVTIFSVHTCLSCQMHACMHVSLILQYSITSSKLLRQ